MRISLFILVFFSLSALIFSCQSNDQYNIIDFGAIPDGKTINTRAIQLALDQCNANGGGVVFVPEGKFISGTIIMSYTWVFQCIVGGVNNLILDFAV